MAMENKEAMRKTF